MQIKHISPDFAVCPQIEVANIRHAVEAGYKTIICNRPDGESNGQPTSESIARAAREAGAEFHYLPIAHGQSTHDEIEKLGGILAAGNGPVLAYCRSGMRSAALYSAHNAQRRVATDTNAPVRSLSGVGRFLSGLRFPLGKTAAE